MKKAGGHRSREPSFGEVGLIVPDIVPGLSLSHGLVPHIELTSLHLSPLDRKITMTMTMTRQKRKYNIIIKSLFVN